MFLVEGIVLIFVLALVGLLTVLLSRYVYDYMMMRLQLQQERERRQHEIAMAREGEDVVKILMMNPELAQTVEQLLAKERKKVRQVEQRE